MAIALVGFTVWAHHMFTSLQPELRIPFMITSMIIAVPTGIKIFSWLGTLWGGKIHFTSAMLFALGFLSMFVIGGISGVMLGAVPVDIHLHDTYFVVSHLHFVLYGGSVLLIFAGIYHWFPKITGRLLDERLGKLHFVMTYFGFFFTFFPQNIAGMQGMPRRIATYLPEFTNINRLISFSAFVLGIATFVLLFNVIYSLYAGKRVGGNPWRALTLEWATTSPPPAYNFYGNPVPFEDPYGYGTEEAAAYVAAVDRRYPPPVEIAAPAPEPAAGD
jgi:cytochrome c oxidase subunit 1